MTHVILTVLLLPLLIIWGIGLCLRSVGLRGLDRLAGMLIVLCLLLSVLWEPVGTMALQAMGWLGRIVLAIPVLCLLAGVAHWLRR